MAADGVHGDIGKVMKKTPKIGDFDVFASVADAPSAQNYKDPQILIEFII